MAAITIHKGFIKWSQSNEPTSNINSLDVWYNTDAEIYNVRNQDSTSWGVYKLCGIYKKDVGIFGKGNIDYITISSTSNATDFGDLTVSRHALSATSNGINERGVFGGGTPNGNMVDYVTISSKGNATDFGDLTIERYYISACSNGINDRGIFAGGHIAQVGDTPRIDYITISTIGNASNFGNLSVNRNSLAATSNGTNERGVFGGGYTYSGSIYRNIIDYITISTTGNATDFGYLTISRRHLAATSNGINDRGIIGGGWNGSTYYNRIDYITISSTGNAADFGDLTISRRHLAATSNSTNDRGVFGGGDTGSNVNIIDYITISTTGNATDFGDLTVSTAGLGACSNA